MSARNSEDHFARPPYPQSLRSDPSRSPQDGVPSHQRNRSFGAAAQHDMTTSPSNLRSPNMYQQPRAANQYPQADDVGIALGGPVLQIPVKTDHQRDRRSPARSSGGGSTPSQLELLTQENARLRKELEAALEDQEQTQNACDSMLTELMTTQESLSDIQASVAAKDTELSALKAQVLRLTDESQNDHPDSLRPGRGRNPTDERELRDLRLRCNRLTKEAERREEQLKQAQEQVSMLKTGPGRSPLGHDLSPEVHELQARCTKATLEAQNHKNQADSYRQTIMEWKDAYDGLQQSYNNIHRSHSELSQQIQAHKAQPVVDERMNKRMEASHTAELNNAMRVSDFYKQNSETVAKKNKAIMSENLALQKSLNEKKREADQQKSLIEALQLQLR